METYYLYLLNNAIDAFSTNFFCFFVDDVSFDHKGLADIGEDEVVIQFGCHPNLSRLNTSMLPTRCVHEVGLCGSMLEIQGEVVEQFWLIPFDREGVVCTAVLHQVSSEFTRCKQGIRGDCSALNSHRIEHRRRNFDFIGLFFFIIAFYRECAHFFWV